MSSGYLTVQTQLQSSKRLSSPASLNRRTPSSPSNLTNPTSRSTMIQIAGGGGTMSTSTPSSSEQQQQQQHHSSQQQFLRSKSSNILKKAEKQSFKPSFSPVLRASHDGIIKNNHSSLQPYSSQQQSQQHSHLLPASAHKRAQSSNINALSNYSTEQPITPNSTSNYVKINSNNLFHKPKHGSQTTIFGGITQNSSAIAAIGSGNTSSISSGNTHTGIPANSTKTFINFDKIPAKLRPKPLSQQQQQQYQEYQNQPSQQSDNHNIFSLHTPISLQSAATAASTNIPPSPLPTRIASSSSSNRNTGYTSIQTRLEQSQNDRLPKLKLKLEHSLDSTSISGILSSQQPSSASSSSQTTTQNTAKTMTSKDLLKAKLSHDLFKESSLIEATAMAPIVSPPNNPSMKLNSSKLTSAVTTSSTSTATSQHPYQHLNNSTKIFLNSQAKNLIGLVENSSTGGTTTSSQKQNNPNYTLFQPVQQQQQQQQQSNPQRISISRNGSSEKPMTPNQSNQNNPIPRFAFSREAPRDMDSRERPQSEIFSTLDASLSQQAATKKTPFEFVASYNSALSNHKKSFSHNIFNNSTTATTTAMNSTNHHGSNSMTGLSSGTMRKPSADSAKQLQQQQHYLGGSSNGSNNNNNNRYSVTSNRSSSHNPNGSHSMIPSSSSSSNNNNAFGVYGKFAVRTRAGALPGKPVKTNQDSYIIQSNFCQKNNNNNQSESYFFSVCDGHGVNGHHASQLIKKILPSNIEMFLKPSSQLCETSSVLSESQIATVTSAFTQGFQKTSQLLQESGIDIMFSGSTCVSVYATPVAYWCANLGDSRAIVGRKASSSTRWLSVPLSFDQKPDSRGEYERILASGGRVSSYKDAVGNNVGPARVWMRNENIPGLAMARSFGDYVASQVGVISEPEVRRVPVHQDDRFLIIASDGVWEFLSNDDVVNFVAPFFAKNDPDAACEKIVREATAAWKREDDIVDDITVIVVFLNSLAA